MVVDASTLTGKVMCGYQGWFRCQGDGSDCGWKHWSPDKHLKSVPAPNNVVVDFWPDLDQFDHDELYETEFRHANGSKAHVFSSVETKTVVRHLEWMKEYGIDGCFLQRFATGIKPGSRLLRAKNMVLSNVQEGAREHGRVFALMYDLSGLDSGQVMERVCHDWLNLEAERQLTKDSMYLFHNGKPVVSLWGIGFRNRKYSLKECRKLVDFFKEQNCAVMVGLPSFWREGRRDATADKAALHDLIKAADIVCPWTVGRYNSPASATKHAKTVWKPDLHWCDGNNLDFLPVVFPGFSWRNLKGSASPLNQIPRLGGRFLWSQFVAAKETGVKMIYVAMFDEVNEGTAIFKCTNEPPMANGGEFVTYEGLPNDFYLSMVGIGGKVLRGELPKQSKDYAWVKQACIQGSI